jgi:tetratricopeptide (TPR) repeat protein
MKTRYIVLAAIGGLIWTIAIVFAWYWLIRRDEPPPQTKRAAEQPQGQVTPEVFTSEGFALLHRKQQPSNAIVAFEACLREYPDNSDCYHGLAQAQRETGDPASALQNHARAIQLAPGRHDFYWERGVTYARMKNYDGAITNFEACLERKPGFANAQLGLGEAYRNKGDFKTALIHHDEAIALNPRSAWFHRERGNTYQKMGDQERANADFAKARDLEQK